MEILIGYILLGGVTVSALLLTTGLLWHRMAMVNLGIMVLMLTPYLRVVASVAYFAFKERNIKYTFFSGFVLAVLTYSLFLR